MISTTAVVGRGLRKLKKVGMERNFTTESMALRGPNSDSCFEPSRLAPSRAAALEEFYALPVISDRDTP